MVNQTGHVMCVDDDDGDESQSQAADKATASRTPDDRINFSRENDYMSSAHTYAL